MSEVPSVRYSTAFKQKVVEEIDRGELTINEARRLYGIGAHHTIQRWLKQFGRENRLPVTVRIQMKDELRKIKQLEERNTLLEKALAESELDRYVLKKTIEVLEQEYGQVAKKNSDSKSSATSGKTSSKGRASKRSAGTSE